MTSLGIRRRDRSLSDWTLLAGATLAQLAVACALRAMPLPFLRAWARRVRPIANMLLRGSDERIIWAVEATGRRLSPISTCLVRALVIETRLSSKERPLSLAIGVRREPTGALQSHAWVLSGDRALIGGPIDDGFVRVATWESAT
jgi:transglutaminase superfamily protein